MTPRKIDLAAIGAAVIESIGFDAGLAEDAGGTGVWAEHVGSERPVESRGRLGEGAPALVYRLEAADGSRWRVTVEQDMYGLIAELRTPREA